MFYSPSSVFEPAGDHGGCTLHIYSRKVSDHNHHVSLRVQVPHIKAPSAKIDESI